MIEDLLDRQVGVISTAQAVACGISARTVRRRVRACSWRALHPGVFLVGGHRLSDEARVRAAWLWAGGPSATVSGPAAAFWHRMLEQAPADVEITVPRARRLRPQPGVVLRRRDLCARDRVGVRHLWVTGKPLTAIETAALLKRDGSTFLDRALQKHVSLAAVRQAFSRNLGRSGSPAQRRMLGAAADGAESAAERLFMEILRGAGVTGWVLGHPLDGYRIDVAFPALRVAVEIDGWAWHSDVARFVADRRKGNAITGAGWVLLRFTWHDLDARPAECLAELLAALAAARRSA